MIQMNAIIEIQICPLYEVPLERGREGEIHIDKVQATHLLGHMPDVIPPALKIDFQEAIRTFKPSAFSMVPIAQPWERKEVDRLVRFSIQVRLVFVAQGPVILLGNYLNFSHHAVNPSPRQSEAKCRNGSLSACWIALAIATAFKKKKMLVNCSGNCQFALFS
jgi:hypothetical protein